MRSKNVCHCQISRRLLSRELAVGLIVCRLRLLVLCASVEHVHSTGHAKTCWAAGDVAETFLLRLSRASGVDGLACMAGTSTLVSEGVDIQLLRPLLDVDKADLIHVCREHGIMWVEDPTNRSLDFARNHIRHLLASYPSQNQLAARHPKPRNSDSAGCDTELEQHGLQGQDPGSHRVLEDVLRLHTACRRARVALREQAAELLAASWISGGMAPQPHCRLLTAPLAAAPSGVAIRAIGATLQVHPPTPSSLPAKPAKSRPRIHRAG